MARKVVLTDSKGNPIGADKIFQPGSFALEIARGNIAGMAIEHKFGRNPDVDTGTDPEDIWDGGGIWVAPTAARIHQIASTSANDDTDGAGTNAGARTVRVFGLNSSFSLQQEDKVLDGQSNVATLAYTIIYRMQVLTAGATGSNEGTITATADTDGTVTAQINIGNNQTGMAVYQIPDRKTGYMLNFYGSLADSGGAGANVDIQLLVQPFGSVFQVRQFHGLTNAGAAHFNHIFPVPYVSGGLFAKDTIKMQVKTTSANDAVVSAGFDIILVDD